MEYVKIIRVINSLCTYVILHVPYNLYIISMSKSLRYSHNDSVSVGKNLPVVKSNIRVVRFAGSAPLT